jgi:hypothetical protein
MNSLNRKIGDFVLSQMVIGLVIMFFGGLVAPVFWKKPAPEDRVFKTGLFVVWFAFSWAIMLSVIFPNIWVSPIDYIDTNIMNPLAKSLLNP